MNDDRRPAITPHLALRVAVLGGIALTLFAVVFFRLWFLQVLSGEQYVSEARENRTRTVRVQAPRGDILDRTGESVVTSRSARVVQITPDELPEAARDQAAAWGQAMGRRSARRPGAQGPPVPLPPIATAELRRRYSRLGKVLRMSPATIHRRVVEQLVKLPYAAVTLRSDVDFAQVAYLKENKDRFPGVDVEQLFLRRYPHQTLAAQSLGYVGQITEEQLDLRRYRRLKQGAVIGQAGLEYTYDRYLRGEDGAKVLRVDANGDLYGTARRRREPTPGNDLRLSLDLDLQKTGQEAAAAIGGGLPGAFVAMNPRNGEIYALGSYPSFDPAVFTKPISDRRYARLTGKAQGAPLVNRAVAGNYSVGSTFKPITALAALDRGIATPSRVVNDTGCITVGDAPKCNAGKQAYGGVDLARALEVSSDIYFYRMGIELFGLGGQWLQRWARKVGLDRETGVDLPEEQRGLIPDRDWRARINEQERECQRDPDQPDGKPCYVSEVRPYNLGDNANLSVGQGEVQISPLQMAVAYSTIVTDGRVPRPHLGMEVQDSSGRLVQALPDEPARRVKIDDTARGAIMEGLRRAAQAPGGTSQPVFAGWPHGRLPVFGKTGTAQVPLNGGLVDQSWYAAYVPHKTRPIVIVATVERGGFGAERAAPLTCRMLRSWFKQERKVCEPPAQGSVSAGTAD